MGDYGGRFARLDVMIDRDFSAIVNTETAGRTVGSRTAAALQDRGIRVWKVALVEGSVVVQIKLASTDLPAAQGAFEGCKVCIVLPDGTDACPHLAGSVPCDADSGGASAGGDEAVLEETQADDSAGAEGAAGAAAGAAGAAVAAVVAVLALGFAVVRHRRAAESDAADDVEADAPAAARPGPIGPVKAASLSFSTLQSHQYEYETPVHGGAPEVPIYEEPGPGDTLRAESGDAAYADCGVGAPADYACADAAAVETDADYALAGDGLDGDDAIYAFAADGDGSGAPEYEAATALRTLRRGEGSADYAIADGCASIRRASLQLEQRLAVAGEPDYDIAA